MFVCVTNNIITPKKYGEIIMNNRTKQQENILKTVTLAIFTAIAFVAVCAFRINVQFLTLDIKDAIIAVAAMIFGPISAVAMSVCVSFLEMITISSTFIYGFVMNVLSTLSFSVTASLIYKYKRNMFGAVIGLLCGVFAVTAVMLLANFFITPFYMVVDRSTVVGLIPTLLLPFNLTKAILNAAITLLIYKPIITALRRAGVIKSFGNYSFGKTVIIVTIVSLIIIILSIVIFINVLDANITWFNPKE